MWPRFSLILLTHARKKTLQFDEIPNINWSVYEMNKAKNFNIFCRKESTKNVNIQRASINWNWSYQKKQSTVMSIKNSKPQTQAISLSTFNILGARLVESVTWLFSFSKIPVAHTMVKLAISVSYEANVMRCLYVRWAASCYLYWAALFALLSHGKNQHGLFTIFASMAGRIWFFSLSFLCWLSQTGEFH